MFQHPSRASIPVRSRERSGALAGSALRGSPFAPVDRKAIEAQNALWEAIRLDAPERALRALREGARMGAHSASGLPPLQLCIKMRSRKTLLALLGAGAPLELADREGFTPLHWAAQERDTELYQRLISLGAPPSTRDALGRSALELARALWPARPDILALFISAQEREALGEILNPAPLLAPARLRL